MAGKLNLTDCNESSDDESSFPMKRPSLLKQLQNIMGEYPDDIQILYELAQNAEDAKATAMKIMFDSRKIDPGGSYGKYLKSPALCVYNNSVLEEDDWDGIASVYLSHKENIAYKIGRYGQGFKSVFHITDSPVIISGHFVLVIDPFKENKECRRIELIEFEKKIGESGILTSFGLSRKIIREGRYNGTLFWFPLRTSDSPLSKIVYCRAKMEGTLELFKNEIHLVLLFLKYLTQIELWDNKGKLLYKTEMTFNVRQKYDSLCSMWQKIESGSRNTHSIAFNCTTRTIARPCMQSQSSQPWIVVHFYAGHSVMDKPLIALALDSEIACLPYVGVAFQWDITDITKSQSGRVFNFLPMPATNKTNLPIHVNANFALSQNRRHLKLSDGKSSDKFVQWNEAVVGKLLPMAYVKLVEHLIGHSIKKGNLENQIKMVYDCMPQHEVFDDSFWGRCVEEFYNRVKQLPVFFTERNNGNWVCQDSAILCDITTSDILPIQKENIKETIKTVLLYLDKNVVDLRDSMKMLIKHGQIKDISPLDLVKYLKASSSVIRRLSREQRINLLHFIMTDSTIQLDGLELLPLHNKGFESFHENFRGEKFTYFSTLSIDVSVFPGLEDRFVSNDLPDSLLTKLTAMAKEGFCQLRNIEYKHIPQLLDEVFCIHCHYADNGQLLSKQNPSPLDVQWIRKMWSIVINTDDKDDLRYFEKLPMIPQYNPGCSQIDSFYVLKGNYILTGYEKNGFRNLPEKVLNILKSNEITNLDWNEVIESSNIIGKYINYPVYERIIELCKNKPHAKQLIQTYAGFRRDLWLSRKTTAISFGQKEDLVIRLNGILENYPRDHSILKEMIQNADDAGAKEIHIVYDMRNHSTNTVFENWKPLQGHALCLFNDAVFTNDDLEGIKRLGVGSKGDDKTKTGQFGIGFNSVYHITDAPCILALGPDAARGGCFCVLDPYCQYAPLAYDGDPGMCMEAEELMTDYPDVFDTFLSMKELKRNKGTWFRFPIRSSDHVKPQICNSVFSSTDIERLLQNMRKDIQECLLFLLNIKQITISSINSDSVHTVHCSVQVSGVNDAKHKQSQFKEQLKIMNEKIKTSPSTIFTTEIVEFKYLVDVKFNSGLSSRWFIIQTLGFKDPQYIDQTLKESINKKEMIFIPRGGVAFKVSSLDNSSMNSRAFCLLPLPVETGLSFHVNGQFSIDMSRNKLWGSEENKSSDVRRIWNIELIRRCIAYSYAGAIAFLTKYFYEKDVAVVTRKYVDSLPLYLTTKNIFWKELVSYVFFYITKRQLFVYPVIQYEKKEIFSVLNWVRNNPQYEIKEAIHWVCRHNQNEIPILIDDLRCQFVSSSNVERLRNSFLALGMKLVSLPNTIKSSMMSACEHLNNNMDHNKDTCICVQSISSKAAIDFFKSLDFNDCSTSHKFDSVEQVKLCLEYCLRCDDIQEIIGVPLLLKNDESIGTFQNQNQLILSKFVDLLPESSKQFVHKSLVGIAKLRKLSFKNLTLNEFAQLLPSSLDFKFKTYSLNIWTQLDTLLTKEWFECFWEFIDTTDECLDVLKDWTLLPVSMLQKEYLFALKFSDIVIDFGSFDKCPNSELCPILGKLQLPTPIFKSTKLDNVLVKYENTYNVLHSIYSWRHFLEDNIANLTPSERVCLVSYLVSGLNPNEKSKINKLKKLPLFMTIEDNVVSLQTTNFITIKEESYISLPGLGNMCKELDLTVLRYYPELWQLYKIINCCTINIGDWYSKYILPNFRLVEVDYHIFYLDYINDNLLENSYVVSALKKVPFILNGQCISRAEAYFDPDQPLFKILCNNTDFPPSPFDDIKWRKLLVKAGLVSDVSESALLHFARMIEGSLPTEELLSKLQHLLPELYYFMAKEKRISLNFIQQLSKVRFLVIERNESKYEDIHKSLNTNLRLTSFQETIPNDKIELVWTTADVLPRYAMPSDKKLLKKLKTIEEPNLEFVMQHAKNICFALFLSTEDHDETLLTTIMERLYRYLSRKDKNVSELNMLKAIPLIHIINHKKFACPSEVVKNINESNEIPPYLLKAPIEYGKFFKFFNCLGMKDEPTVATYSKVLWKIYRKCGHSSLGPNEIIIVKRALHSFMRAMQQLEEPVDELEVDELYLMSENNQLLPANELYYESLEIRRERLETEETLRFLADFGCLGINVVELPRLFDLIPERYRPLSVHSIVTENLAFYELNESETASKLLEILTSATFINELLRICKHDQKMMSNDLTVKDMQRISARLRRLRIFSVSKLETNLKNGQMEIEGTNSEKSCFYCNEKEIIYIHDNRLEADTWLCRYGIELERILRVVCYGKFHSRSLLYIFNTICSDFNSLHERLTELGITLLEEDIQNLIWYPLPGSCVPREVHSRLRKPLKPIAVNQYAVIPGETDQTNNDELRHFEDTFIYVIVTNAVFSLGQTLQYYWVNVGKQQDIKIDKDLILEIEPLDTHTETNVESELYQDETGIDEIDSRTLHSAREFHVLKLPNPQKQMGWKWFTQAKYDLDAGYATLNGIDLRPFKGFNWICLQCQQATEKAVKAAQYATDAYEVHRSHYFTDNIPNGDERLFTLCRELSPLVGHINDLRYPDNNSPIPAERYNRDDATMALCLTDKILTYVSDKYFM